MEQNPMMADTTILALSAVLTLLMLATGSALRTRVWTPGGIARATGNRDGLGEPSPIASRADRAAKNMLENLVLLVALLAAVHFAGKVNAQVQLGANVFFWARVVYWPAYVTGVPLVRSIVWMISIVGLAMIGLALAS
jgi:uncharacterized MAPEG superfamily protein